MKRCSSCDQTYDDDMMYCLSDGTPLGVVISDVEQPTVAHPSIATVVAPSPAKGASGSGAKYFVAGTAFLLVFGFLVLASAALIFWPRGGAPGNSNLINAPNSPLPTPTRAVEPPMNVDLTSLKDLEDELARERKKLADERKKLEDEKRKNDEKPADPLSPPSFDDPGTARISFRRGSIGETVSGTVGRSRSYVLRTGFGQYLSADVSSGGGCVVFSNGSRNISFTTSRGDTYLNIRNNCDKPTNFSISVTVR